MVVNRSEQEDVCSRNIEGFLEKIWKRIFCKVRTYMYSLQELYFDHIFHYRPVTTLEKQSSMKFLTFNSTYRGKEIIT